MGRHRKRISGAELLRRRQGLVSRTKAVLMEYNEDRFVELESTTHGTFEVFKNQAQRRDVITIIENRTLKLRGKLMRCLYKKGSLRAPLGQLKTYLDTHPAKRKSFTNAIKQMATLTDGSTSWSRSVVSFPLVTCTKEVRATVVAGFKKEDSTSNKQNKGNASQWSSSILKVCSVHMAMCLEDNQLRGGTPRDSSDYDVEDLYARWSNTYTKPVLVSLERIHTTMHEFCSPDKPDALRTTFINYMWAQNSALKTINNYRFIVNRYWCSHIGANERQRYYINTAFESALRDTDAKTTSINRNTPFKSKLEREIFMNRMLTMDECASILNKGSEFFQATLAEYRQFRREAAVYNRSHRHSSKVYDMPFELKRKKGLVMGFITAVLVLACTGARLGSLGRVLASDVVESYQRQDFLVRARGNKNDATMARDYFFIPHDWRLIVHMYLTVGRQFVLHHSNEKDTDAFFPRTLSRGPSQDNEDEDSDYFPDEISAKDDPTALTARLQQFFQHFTGKNVGGKSLRGMIETMVQFLGSQEEQDIVATSQMHTKKVSQSSFYNYLKGTKHVMLYPQAIANIFNINSGSQTYEAIGKESVANIMGNNINPEDYLMDKSQPANQPQYSSVLMKETVEYAAAARCELYGGVSTAKARGKRYRMVEKPNPKNPDANYSDQTRVRHKKPKRSKKR
jgi:hypothetical protein